MLLIVLTLLLAGWVPTYSTHVPDARIPQANRTFTSTAVNDYLTTLASRMKDRCVRFISVVPQSSLIPASCVFALLANYIFLPR